MSEHTPLTEAERELLRDWWDSESESDTADTMLANLDATVERILAARTSTATADTGLRERVEALAEAVGECRVFRAPASEISCRELIGGIFNKGKWTEDMCCLPCRVREALRGDQ